MAKDLFPQLPTIRDFFNNNHQFIGFGPSLERLFRELDHNLFSVQDNYPPYSIQQIDLGEGTQIYKPREARDYVIEIACAGFNKDQLTVVQNDNILTVQGTLKEDLATPAPTEIPLTQEKPEEAPKVEWNGYIYKGIAQRSWMRRFSISDNLKVHKIQYENGLLKIFLKNTNEDKTIAHAIE